MAGLQSPASEQLARVAKWVSRLCNPTSMNLACGIDLGLRPKTAMVFISYKNNKFSLESEVFSGLPDEAIEELIWKNRPHTTAIDAPLSASMEKRRPAEPKLREMLRNYTNEFKAESSIASPFALTIFPITYRGKYLRQRLQPITDVIETHPLIDYLFLDRNPKNTKLIKARKQNPKILREILTNYVQNLPESLNDDQYDAIIAAMVACSYTESTSLGLTKLPKLYNTDADFVIFDPTT